MGGRVVALGERRSIRGGLLLRSMARGACRRDNTFRTSIRRGARNDRLSSRTSSKRNLLAAFFSIGAVGEWPSGSGARRDSDAAAALVEGLHGHTGFAQTR